MCSIGLKSGLQAGLFLGSILLSDLDQYLNCGTTKYLARFKTKFQILWTQDFINLK